MALMKVLYIILYSYYYLTLTITHSVHGISNNSMNELSWELGAHLDKLNEAVQIVKKNASQNLDEVDKRREKLDKKIRELHDMIQTETEKQMIDIFLATKRKTWRSWRK